MLEVSFGGGEERGPGDLRGWGAGRIGAKEGFRGGALLVSGDVPLDGEGGLDLDAIEGGDNGEVAAAADVAAAPGQAVVPGPWDDRRVGDDQHGGGDQQDRRSHPDAAAAYGHP